MGETNAKPLVMTDADFSAKVEQSPSLALVDFWAEWCGPCRVIAPTLEKLAADYAGRIHIFKLDVDENPLTAQRFGIRSIPSLLFFKGGKVVDTVIGAVPESHLREKIDKYL